MGTLAEKRKKIRDKLKHFGRTAALGGLTFVSTVFGNGKTANAQTPVKDAQQNQTEAPAPKHVRSYGTSKDTINLSSMLSKDEMLLNQVVAELSDDPEFVANLLQERGLNTLSNFDFKGFNWTAEDLQDLKNDGPMSQKLKNNIGVVDRENKTGRNCLAAIKAGLRMVGFDCPAGSPYQMPFYLNQSDKFVEIKINVDPKTSWSHDYETLYNIGDCAFVFQNQNKKKYPDVIHGHSSITWTENGKRVQKSGMKGPKGFPTSDRRNASTYYNGYRVYCFSDSHVKEALLVKLVEEDRCTIRIDSLVRVYLLENSQYAQRYGINVNNIKAAQKANKNGAEVIRTENNKKDVNEKADDAGTTYVAANQTVKKKAPRKNDISLRGKELAAYIRSTRNRV